MQYVVENNYLKSLVLYFIQTKYFTDCIPFKQIFMSMHPKVSVFWFRRDLRLDDNHALYLALSSGYPVVAVFLFDRDILDKLESKTDKRVNLIYDKLLELNKILAKAGSFLFTYNGFAKDMFSDLSGKFEIHSVFANEDYEPYAVKRDNEVRIFLKVNGISFVTVKDQVIYRYNEVLKPSDGSCYTIFTPYCRKWKERYNMESHQKFSSETLLRHLYKTNQGVFPSLDSIGFVKREYFLSDMNISDEILTHYEAGRNNPALDATSHVSVSLRFGFVSIRELVKLAFAKSEIWLNELIWREFFMQILANFPYVKTEPFKKQYDRIIWRNDEKEFECWKNGQTGFPIVDAGLRQLNTTGYMHNRVRMITASFLVKHLLIDWRWGEAYFAEKLMDFDLAANNGNWQWTAGCGCDAVPYFRIFNPVLQQQKFDPDFAYSLRWVPELNTLAYPAKIIDMNEAKARCMRVYKEALEQERSGR